MKRTQAAIAAFAVALAIFATVWAIGVNSGILSDGPGHEPVSARTEVTDSVVAGSEYVPPGATETADPEWHGEPSRSGEENDDDHDDREEGESGKEREHETPRDREHGERHDDD
ncbi:MAG: hypothetical protein DCC49_03805 [Acidobacteria bacterium]|nr:MAG: hypothetical protein DCC49_03805 [Acidobacteriota bacterium]